MTGTNINLRKEFQEWKEILAEGKYKKSQNNDWKVLFFDLHLSITIGIYNADTLCACTCMHVCKCERAHTPARAHTHTLAKTWILASNSSLRENAENYTVK